MVNWAIHVSLWTLRNSAQVAKAAFGWEDDGTHGGSIRPEGPVGRFSRRPALHFVVELSGWPPIFLEASAGALASDVPGADSSALAASQIFIDGMLVRFRGGQITVGDKPLDRRMPRPDRIVVRMVLSTQVRSGQVPRLLVNQLRAVGEELARLPVEPGVPESVTLGESAVDQQVMTPSYQARLAELRWMYLQVRRPVTTGRGFRLMAEIAVLLWHLGLAAPQNEGGHPLTAGSRSYQQRITALSTSRVLIEEVNSWRPVARSLQTLEHLTQQTLSVVQRAVDDVAAPFGGLVTHLDDRHLELTIGDHRLTVKTLEAVEARSHTVEVLDDTVIITTASLVDNRSLAEAVAWGIESAIADSGLGPDAHRKHEENRQHLGREGKRE